MMSDQYSVNYLVRRLLGLMWTSPAMTIVAAISILTSIGFSLALPLLIRALINSGVAAGQHRVIAELGVAIIVVSALSAASAYVRGVTTQWVGETVSYDLRNRL